MENKNVRMIKHYFRKIIKNIITNNCNLSSKINLNGKLTIQEIIDQKTNKTEEEKFLLYVSAIHGITFDINDCFPFIDMSELDLSWNIDRILNILMKSYTRIEIRLDMNGFIKNKETKRCEKKNETRTKYV